MKRTSFFGFVLLLAALQPALAEVRTESQRGFGNLSTPISSGSFGTPGIERPSFPERQVQNRPRPTPTQPVDTYNNMKSFDYKDSMSWKDDFKAEGPTLSAGAMCAYRIKKKPYVVFLPACEVTLSYTEPTVQVESVGSRGFSHIDKNLPQPQGNNPQHTPGMTGNRLHHLMGFAHAHLWGLTPQDRFDSSATDMQAKQSLSCDLAKVWETWDNLNSSFVATPQVKLMSSTRVFLVDSLNSSVDAWFPGSTRGSTLPELFETDVVKEATSQLNKVTDFAGSMDDGFELLTHADGFENLEDLADRIEKFPNLEQTINQFGGLDQIGKMMENTKKQAASGARQVSGQVNAKLSEIQKIIEDSGGVQEFKEMIADAGSVKELQNLASKVEGLQTAKEAIEAYGNPEKIIELVGIGGLELDVIAAWAKADKLRQLYISEKDEGQWIRNNSGETGGLCGVDGVYRPEVGRSGKVGDLTDVDFDQSGTCKSKVEHTWPVSGTQQGDRVSSGFGLRTHPVTGQPTSMHKGIDISEGGACGADIVATAAGTVTEARRMTGYGLTVYIRHSDGGVTRYGHLASINVSQGQQVSQGQVVGKMGSTGVSTGCHLHYETRDEEGNAYNPYPCIAEARGQSLNNDVATAAGAALPDAGNELMSQAGEVAGQVQDAVGQVQGVLSGVQNALGGLASGFGSGQPNNMCIGTWDSLKPHTGFYPGTGRRGVGLALTSWRAYDTAMAKGKISPLKIQQGTAPNAVGYQLTEFNIDYPYKTKGRFPIGSDPLEWESPDEGRQNRALDTYSAEDPNNMGEVVRTFQDGMISTYWKQTSCTITYCCDPHLIAGYPVFSPINKAWLIKKVKDNK